ncbi:MAG: hypothetical protein ACR2FM_01895 [Candidatus Saccharimonadales bacterium]
MVKSFNKYFKIGSSNDPIHSNQSSHSVYKYSMYMQSKDSAWLNRNLKKSYEDEINEPVEEDIRD